MQSVTLLLFATLALFALVCQASVLREAEIKAKDAPQLLLQRRQHQLLQQQQKQQEEDDADLKESFMHPERPYHSSSGRDAADDHGNNERYPGPVEEWDSEYWRSRAAASLDELLQRRTNTGLAKNLILFMGDGMSIPTLAAARVYLGDEKLQLSFEKFPAVGLSKTYCVDTQVADSACSATAYLCGVKANMATMGVNANVLRHNCTGQKEASNNVDSIVAWGQRAGKWTGVVTTTRITHASPGGAYAHTANRDWEDDKFLAEDKKAIDTEGCSDIAQQLVRDAPGKDLRVIMGGGRRGFVPHSENSNGRRLDGVNLINEWKEGKPSAAYVQNKTELRGVDLQTTEYLLGLFQWSHMKYHFDDPGQEQPTLAEMVESAITMLSRQEKGFVLFVEGGRIDHAHHDDLAHYALEETLQFSEAIARATELTSTEDTLIVVTSDHAHTMSMSGYANRGNDIFGYAGEGDDKKGYTTLSYANGPGYKSRTAVTPQERYDDISDMFPATAPLDSETHGGDDVGIFALGPWSHLFTGVHEQNMIPVIMAYAGGIGPYEGRGTSAAGRQEALLLLLLPALLLPLRLLL